MACLFLRVASLISSSSTSGPTKSRDIRRLPPRGNSVIYGTGDKPTTTLTETMSLTKKTNMNGETYATARFGSVDGLNGGPAMTLIPMRVEMSEKSNIVVFECDTLT